MNKRNTAFTKADFIQRPANGIGSALAELGFRVPLRSEGKAIAHVVVEDDHYETRHIPLAA